MGSGRRVTSDAARAGFLSSEETCIFGGALRGLREREIPYLVGGGFAFSRYSGLRRNTKDMDVVLTQAHFLPAVEVLREAGLRDYYEVETYDRSWIYRGYTDLHGARVIVDVIHRFPNRVGVVEESWIGRGVPGRFAGEPVRWVSPEDLIWMKLFVLQRERCDWPDLFNIIRGLAGALEWDYLLERAGEHWRLLDAVVEIYDWLCPAERDFIPSSVRLEFDRRRQVPESPRGSRATLLDSRPWLTRPGAGLLDLDDPALLVETLMSGDVEEEREALSAA